MMGLKGIRRRFAGGSAANSAEIAFADIRRRLDTLREDLQDLQKQIIRNQNASSAAIGDAMKETLEEAQRLFAETEEKRKHARQAEERTRHMIRRATESAQPQPQPKPQVNDVAAAKPLPPWVPR